MSHWMAFDLGFMLGAGFTRGQFNAIASSFIGTLTGMNVMLSIIQLNIEDCRKALLMVARSRYRGEGGLALDPDIGPKCETKQEVVGQGQ